MYFPLLLWKRFSLDESVNTLAAIDDSSRFYHSLPSTIRYRVLVMRYQTNQGK